MSYVLLLTAEELPAGAHDQDTDLLASALTERDVGVTVLPWTSPAIGHGPERSVDADLVVIRTTWDYTFRLDEFLTAVHAFPMPVANPPAVVSWNAHKGYLAELSEDGVAVVPTMLVRRGEPALLPTRVTASGTDRIIVKPASAAGARGVGLFEVDSPAAVEHLRDLLESGDVLVQPFQPSVRDGERSLIYLGGAFSHAVRKVPAAGDFRVQTRYGGQVLPHRASTAELDAAAAALDRVGEELLYAGST